jgi:hypothetical protein
VKKGRIRNIIGKVNDMGTINDLLYNYQEGNEFVCSDGRMSVNGICQVEQPVDSVDTSNLTKEIIETSKGGEGLSEDQKQWIKDREEKVKREKVLEDLEGTSDYFPKLGKEKKKRGKFEWDFDKEKKMDGYKNTVNNNIAAYNNWVETNFGISTEVQNVARVVGTVGALTSGASAAAIITPWAIPFFAGGAINRAEKERIENITDQDKQGGNIQTIDMMTYDIPQPGDDGFNPHKDKGDEPDWRGTTQDQGETSDAGFDSSPTKVGNPFGY